MEECRVRQRHDVNERTGSQSALKWHAEREQASHCSLNGSKMDIPPAERNPLRTSAMLCRDLATCWPPPLRLQAPYPVCRTRCGRCETRGYRDCHHPHVQHPSFATRTCSGKSPSFSRPLSSGSSMTHAASTHSPPAFFISSMPAPARGRGYAVPAEKP